MRETHVSKLNLDALEIIFNRLTTVSNYRYSGHYKGYYRHDTRFDFEESVFISYLNKTYDLNISIENTYYMTPCTLLKWDYNYVCSQLNSVKFSDFKDDFLKYYNDTERTCHFQVQVFLILLSIFCLANIIWYLFLE